MGSKPFNLREVALGLSRRRLPAQRPTRPPPPRHGPMGRLHRNLHGARL